MYTNPTEIFFVSADADFIILHYDISQKGLVHFYIMTQKIYIHFYIFNFNTAEQTVTTFKVTLHVFAKYKFACSAELPTFT